MSEAMNERMVPGTGEMPLVEMIRAIRRDVVVSIEVPMRSLKKAGMSEVERVRLAVDGRSEEHTSELQSLMRISYAVFCLKKKKHTATKRFSDTTIVYNQATY